jgi:hypothetical protein
MTDTPAEVAEALNRLSFKSTDDHLTLRAHIAELERQLAEAREDAADWMHDCKTAESQLAAQRERDGRDSERLDYIERTFSGMTNRERYLPVQMIWGKGANGRTLREACDKYMARDAAIAQGDKA